MFHPALWKLLRLQCRGWFRQFRRSLVTFRGLFQLAFIIAILAQNKITMFFAGAFAAQSPQMPGLIESLLTVGLFVFTCYVVLFSTGEAAVYFTSSEVAFLFPAPLSRRQLLTYALLKGQIAIVAMSFVFAFLSTSDIRMALPRWIAIVLTMSFLQLVTMTVAFLRQVLQHKMHVLIRKVLGLFVGVMILVTVSQVAQSLPKTDLREYEKALLESANGLLILAPFRVFARTIFAPDWVTFIPWVSVLLLVDSLLLLLVFRLDSLSLEAALAISEKITARMKLMRAKGVWQGFGATSAVARRRLPKFPFWTGVGPVLWQRMTTVIRSSTQLFWLLAGAVAFAAGVVYWIGSSGGATYAGPVGGLFAMVYISFLISLTLQNEIEHVGYLKSLPLRTRSIVLGELIGIPILLSIIQSLFIAVEACFFTDFAGWLLPATLLTWPLNFVLFGIDKLIFYIYPTRLAKGAPGDFQNAGKQLVFMTLKMLMIGLAALLVAIAALPGAILLQSSFVGVASAVIVLIIECVAIVPLLTIAFDRFDPGVTLVS